MDLNRSIIQTQTGVLPNGEKMDQIEKLKPLQFSKCRYCEKQLISELKISTCNECILSFNQIELQHKKPKK